MAMTAAESKQYRAEPESESDLTWVKSYRVYFEVEYLPGKRCQVYLSREFFDLKLAEISLKQVQRKIPEAALFLGGQPINRNAKTDREEMDHLLQRARSDAKLANHYEKQALASPPPT